MNRQQAVPRGLATKGSKTRRKLARVIRLVRRLDRKPTAEYCPESPMFKIPFWVQLLKAVEAKAKTGSEKIRVLDKGAGTGRISAIVKKTDPQRIEITAIGLTKSIAPENAPAITKFVREAGIRARHEKPFDIIFDAFGEDYRLPKELVRQSIEKTISDLAPGGVAFTIVPMSFKKRKTIMTLVQGRRMAAEFKKRKGIVVEAREIARETEALKYMDLAITIRKKALV
jgi:SAM-dependent methyltransferase